jgi:membrane-associated phospholipid phosphatase
MNPTCTRTSELTIPSSSATAALGGGFSKIKGFQHAFSLDDPAISFPYQPDTVTVEVLLIVAVVAPGIITALVSLLFVPGPTAARNTPKALIWRRKLWEWNTAWMGLGVALAGAFMVTEGLKDIAGKPRPDLLQRCDPDLSKVTQFHVGGLGLVYPEAPVLVSSGICQQTDASILRDGFASWPSGHSSFSWAGLFYLTLFLCAKFAIAIPFLGTQNYSHHQANLPSTFEQRHGKEGGLDAHVPARNQAAAPPIYLLIIAFIPIGTAMFICVTRYADYHHAGWDIISGALIGAFFAYFGFRWYHLPIRQGAGWAWGARSRDRAFFLPIGTPSYVGDEGWDSAKSAARQNDRLENGPREEAMLEGGMEDHPEDVTVNRDQAFGTTKSNSEASHYVNGSDQV